MNEQEILKFLQIQTLKYQQKHHTTFSNQLFSGIKLKCPGGKDALTYCLSCSNCAVACVDQECMQCYKAHLKCQRMKKIKKFHNQIQETIQPSFILGEIEQNVNKINRIVIAMQQQITNQLKTFKLTKADQQIVSKIKKYYENKSQIFSSDFITHQEDKQKCKNQWFQDQIQKFSSIIQRTKNKIIHIFKDIQKSIHYQHLQNSSSFDDKIFKESRILNNKVWKNQMLLMLKDLAPIKEIQRIYCASTDAFLAESFHKQCDNKSNLLYVVRNEFDKTYGGFSPCSISYTRTQQFQTDQSMSSFIFSLDLHAKSNLLKKQFSIRNSYKPKNKGNVLVAFGNNTSPNLVISQNSFGLSRDNWIDMYGGAYQEYSDNLEQLIGTKQHLMCKLKQFEVFQIKFVNQDFKHMNTCQNKLKQTGNSQQKDINKQTQMEKIDLQKIEIEQKIQQQYCTDKQQKINTNNKNSQGKIKSKTKLIQKQIIKSALRPTKETRKITKPSQKIAEQPQQKKQIIQEELKTRKRGRPKKNDIENQEQINKLINEKYNQKDDKIECQENNQQEISHLFLNRLLGIAPQSLGRLSFLFNENNQESSSQSHQGRKRRHGHHRHHGGHKHNHWKRHHHW